MSVYTLQTALDGPAAILHRVTGKVTQKRIRRKGIEIYKLVYTHLAFVLLIIKLFSLSV